MGFIETELSDVLVRMGERFRALRTNAGLRQSELSWLLGVEQQTISRWESGRSGAALENLLMLKQVYGVSWGVLLGEDAFDQNDVVDVRERCRDGLARYEAELKRRAQARGNFQVAKGARGEYKAKPKVVRGRKS